MMEWKTENAETQHSVGPQAPRVISPNEKSSHNRTIEFGSRLLGRQSCGGSDCLVISYVSVPWDVGDVLISWALRSQASSSDHDPAFAHVQKAAATVEGSGYTITI